MTKSHTRARAIAFAAVGAAFGATLIGGGTAYAHGSCWATAQIPSLIIPNQVGGGNTVECSYNHATLKACVQLQWRSTTSSSWTNIGTQACDTSYSSAYEYVSKTVSCTTGYWRSHGAGEIKNSDGVVAHTATPNISERFITCASRTEGGRVRARARPPSSRYVSSSGTSGSCRSEPAC